MIAFVTLVAFDGIQEKIRTRRRPELDLQIECDHMGDIMVELSHLAERHFAKLLNLSFGRTPHNTYIISFRASFHRTDMSPRRMHSVRSWQVFPA